MNTRIWELRFLDGRGARFFTNVDITADVARRGLTRTIPVATGVSEDRAVGDARRAISDDNVTLLTFHMRALAFVLAHE